MSSELYFDRLAAYEARCVAVLAGLGTITSNAVGMSAETPAGATTGTPWIDVMIVRAEGGEVSGGAQTITVETTIQVVVVGTEWPSTTRLARWTLAMADARLRADSELASLFGRVQGTSNQDARTEPQSTPEVIFQTVIRSEILYRQPQGAIAGLVVSLDAQDDEGGIDRGHATALETAPLVTFATLLPKPVPHAPTAMYANAVAGDTVEVLDESDAVVVTAPVVALPAGQVTLPALPAGVYTLRMSGSRSLYALTITEAPV